MFLRVAGTEVSCREALSLAKSSTLKVSIGRSPERSSRIIALAVSSGKPNMEPETSTTKT